MVRTSMLPVRGITELSASPSRIKPTPPKWRSCRQMGTANKGWRWRSIRVGGVELNDYSVCGQKTNRRRGRQRADLGRIAIEKLQALETGRVEIVINVFC